MKRWKKLGNIFQNNGLHEKLKTHASNPTPYFINDDTVRVFYSGRDSAKRSSIGYFDYSMKNKNVIYTHEEPFIEHGDDLSISRSGLGLGCVSREDDKLVFWCMGWQCDAGMHWRGDIVKVEYDLISQDVFYFPKPILPLNELDQISFSYPWVFREGNTRIMFYGSTLTWDGPNQEMIHTIHQCTEKSPNSWGGRKMSFPWEENKAQAFSRPTVIEMDNYYHMWYSYRPGMDKKYRIGHAFSKDLLNWEMDLSNIVLETSQQGWDSEMVEYPAVFEYDQSIYMLYNGNGYGESGIGLAILKEFAN